MLKNISASQRNSYLALSDKFFENINFLLPIWILFGTNVLEFSTTLTTALMLIVWLGGSLIEIPTGALADRYGRRKIYLLGASLITFYPLVYAVEAKLAIIIIVSLIAAVGSALRTGTLEAAVYASYEHDDRSESEFHSYLSNSQIVTFISRVLGGVLGGVLYGIDPHLPYVATAVSYVFAGCSAILFIETIGEKSHLTNFAHIKKTFIKMFEVKAIKLFTIIYVFQAIASEGIWTALQPFFEEDKISPTQIGLIFSGIAIISSISAYYVKFAMKNHGLYWIGLLNASLVLISVSLFLTPLVILHVLAVVPMAFAFGINFTPFTAVAQKYVDKKYHSTVLSVISFIQIGMYGVATLAVSIIIDIAGISPSKIYLFAVMVLAFIIAAGIYKAEYKNDEIITET